MIHRRTALIGAPLLLGLSGRARAADTVRIVDDVELSGTGVTSGSMWQKGVELALKEINASGGILGRQVAMTHQDNQSQAQVAKAIATRAIDDDAYVILGPIFSGNVNVTMAVGEENETPIIMGGEATALTRQGAKYLFRTSLSQAAAMPKLAAFLQKQGIKSLAVVWIANDFGKGGRDAILAEMAKRDIKAAVDISTEPGQMDYSAAVVNATKANADALFVYLNEEECARFLIALRKFGYAKPVYGETVLVSQRVIELAGAAANGAKGHVGLTVDAPNERVREFGRKFQAANGFASDHNGIKGYTGLYFVKYVTEKIGKFDRKAFAAALHGMRFVADQQPGVLLDVSFDDKGDLDRESYLVEVRDGKQVVTDVLPPLNAGRS
jgi:branched-chain amino acid transport system substrate-binding protein